MVVPHQKPVPLNGTDVSAPFSFEGVTELSISPRAAVTTQFSIDGDANTLPNFSQIVNGQPFTMRAPDGKVFDKFNLTLYAGAAVTVDLVWW